jgi:hypothetical protein
MIIYVDIDETICETASDRNYVNAKPLKERIAKINKLYDEGNTIIYWTARGTGTGINWQDVTEKELKFQKPIYDLFIDDKNINSETYFE